MASHCQCHHQYPHHQQQNHHLLHHQTSCYSSSSCCNSCPSSHPSPPPHSHHSQTTPDPLVQALAAQLLQFSQSFQPHHQYQQHSPNQQHHQHQTQQTQTQTLFTSLIHRIDALESSLHHLSSSPSPKPPSLSLRDLAARTIQTHFRAFLVHRSRTLRNLKHLAIVKSNLNSLKSSLSDKPHHVNYQALSQKAMDLLLKLDSVQGGDPMVRDGKKSISRELVRFLEFVDGAVVKKQHHYHKQQQQQQKRGFSKPRKNVRFAEEISESRSYIDTPKEESSCEDEDDVIDVDDQQQLVENLCRRVEEMEGFARASENDQEEAPRKNVKTTGEYENASRFQDQNGSFRFSPPLPVQMEPRQDEFVKRETR